MYSQQSLASVDDVKLLMGSDMSRSDTDLANLARVASSLLRQRVPWVDERIEKFEIEPGSPGSLDPTVVASVIAGVVKRFLDNPSGSTSVTKQETVGPYSISETNSFATRSGLEIGSGALTITDADVAALGTFGQISKGKIGTMRLGSRF